MKMKVAIAEFDRLVRRTAQYSARGRDIQPGHRLMLINVTDRGTLRVSAHTPGSGARSSVRVQDHSPGTVAVSAQHLEKIITILPKQRDLTLTTGRGPNARLVCGGVRMTLPLAQVDEFPDMPRPPAEGWHKVTDRELSSVIRRLLWCMCKDKTRPALSGVHLTPEHSESTDGHISARKSPGFVNESVVVPGDAWHRLRAFVSNSDEELDLAVEDGRRFWVRGRNWATFTALLPGPFPDMSSFIFSVDDQGTHDFGHARTRVHWIHVNRQEVLAAVSRIVGASVSQDEKSVGASVKFEYRDDELHLVSDYPIDDVSNSIIVDEVVGWAEGSIKADNTAGFWVLDHIAVYSTYARMALESLSSDVVRVMWAEPVNNRYAPFQFHDDVVGMRALVMPRRLKEGT